MTEIATMHVHMLDFLSVIENLWLCSVHVQEYLFHCVKVSPVIIHFIIFVFLFRGVRVARSFLFSVKQKHKPYTTVQIRHTYNTLTDTK